MATPHLLPHPTRTLLCSAESEHRDAPSFTWVCTKSEDLSQRWREHTRGIKLRGEKLRQPDEAAQLPSHPLLLPNAVRGPMHPWHGHPPAAAALSPHLPYVGSEAAAGHLGLYIIRCFLGLLPSLSRLMWFPLTCI